MCFPAAAAARTRSRCLFVSEQITTAATSGSDQTAPRSGATAAARSEARLSARARLWSHTYLTRTPGLLSLRSLMKPGVWTCAQPTNASVTALAGSPPEAAIRPPGSAARSAAPLAVLMKPRRSSAGTGGGSLCIRGSALEVRFPARVNDPARPGRGGRPAGRALEFPDVEFDHSHYSLHHPG